MRSRPTWMIALLLLATASSLQCTSLFPAPDPPPRASSCEGPVVRTPIGGENPNLIGFADYSAHMFSEYSFGQYLFQGKSYPARDGSPDAQLADALGPCRHESLRHARTGLAVRYVEGSHSAAGYPTFADWPNYWMLLHQQMYVDWVYRAYRHGLRLMVLSITNSRTLCERFHQGPDAPCSDGDVIAAQLDAVHRMLATIAAREGGWMRLARSSREAAELIRENRLALVLAIDVDTLFGCGAEGDAHCAPTSYALALAGLFGAGVRQITPIHLVDNGFGGAAIFDDHMNVNQLYLRGQMLAVDPTGCSDERVDFELTGGAASFVTALLTAGRWYLPHYPPPDRDGRVGHCNARGLSRDGESLVRDLMRRGMLIDLEYMSDRATQETVALARANCADLARGRTCYPLLASHSLARDLKRRLREGEQVGFIRPGEVVDATSELQTPPSALTAIRELGGVVGVTTNPGQLFRGDDGASGAADACPTSSESVARALAYTVAQMDGRGGVGFGTDFNGFAAQAGPRFGARACGERGAPDRRAELAYPFVDYFGAPTPCTRAGERDFDFNRDGLAHYGLLPDLIADMKLVGASSDVVDTVFASARAYVEMWERAESVAEAGARTHG